MGYLVEGLEHFIRKVAYKKCDATALVRWSNYTGDLSENTGTFLPYNWLLKYDVPSEML
jgi:hypothetical protein